MKTALGIILFIAIIATPFAFVIKEIIEDHGLKAFLIGLGILLVSAVVFFGLLLLSVWLIVG